MTTPLPNVGEIVAGKYRVDRILGVGGMGMVLAVTHLELEQRMALKLMRADTATSAGAKDRFLREARAAVKLKGEHVCRVFDTGKLDEGEPYIAMELLEGEDFSRLLQRRAPLSVTDTVDYMLQAIEGVAEAHANQIVHRDLKPGNLFVAVDNDGSPLVKVLDFGISKSSSIAGGITQTGDIMGSPSYMAPEQMASAKDVDVRADIWALGVILYQASSRRLPFEHDSLPALCAALATDDPTPLDQVAKLPPAFTAVVMRCLAKRPEDRPADVGELATLLAPLGGRDATQTAARIVKVLHRQQPASRSALALDATLPPDAPVDPSSATQATADVPAVGGPVAALAGQSSTFQAGAAQSLGSLVPAPASRRPLIFVALGALAVSGVVFAMVSTRGGDGDLTRAIPPSARPSQPTAVEPEPPPDPQPQQPAGSAAEPVVDQLPPKEPVRKPKSGTRVRPPEPGTTTTTTSPPAPTEAATVRPDAGTDRVIFKGSKGTIKTDYP